GGLDGLGASVITQRPAVLNKSIVTQCDMIIATCLSHPLDIKPIEDWMKVYVSDRAMVQEVVDSLPSLSKGQAWVWAPDHQIRELAWFRELRTFDSGRTPKPGEKRRVPRALTKVDLEALDERIKARGAIQKANDPKALKARIAELEKQAAVKAQVLDRSVKLHIQADTIARNATERAAKLDTKHLDRVDSLLKRSEAGYKALANVVSDLDAQRDRLAQAHQALVSETGNLVTAVHNLRTAYTDSPAPAPAPPRVTTNGHNGTPVTSIRQIRTGAGASEIEGWTTACRNLLTVLAQHPAGLPKNKILIHAGYRSSGDISKAFALLSREGLMEPVEHQHGVFAITQRGRTVLGPVDPRPTGDELYTSLLAGNKLNKPEKAFLTAARAAHPKNITKGTILEQTGYKSSGDVSKAFAHLIKLGYFHAVGIGSVKLADELAS
ncbi:MAG TPA: hypothetical protein VF488_12585, partial [Gemmatimonadaceae bacterium]